MKNFKSWGIKTKVYPEYNYRAVWTNLRTIRFGEGSAKELPPDKSEFYDVSLGTNCNLCCPFCYVGASDRGRVYTDICEKAKFFFGSMEDNDKPFQVAIGSEGEPTIHPDFLNFVETVHGLGIVPNYTTNGITIARDDSYSEKLLEYTGKYCGGVAVSTNHFNAEIWDAWIKAVDKLLRTDVHTNLHVIVSDEESVKRLGEIYKTFGKDIHTYVLLPLMKEGRSDKGMDDKVFAGLRDWFGTIDGKNHFAFGANFYPYLLNQDDGHYKIECSMYEPESFSKNLILDDTIKITPSSFNRNTILYSKKFEK